VQDVSFEIFAGETLGLVGESGCGKTVTVRAILGLLPPGGRVIGGHCRFGGSTLIATDGRRYPKLRGSQIALISQEPVASLDPNYTVGAQIAQVVRRHHQVSRAAARARAIGLLDQVELPEAKTVAGRYPYELSGGMAQRVCIAAALAGEPRLLIADEPTTALDVTVQAAILDLLRELQARTGMAIVIVTHDWGVVADICDRAVVMYAGQIVEATDVGPMFRSPLHPYTDGLLRANPHGAPVAEPLPAIAGAVPAPDEWPTSCHFAPRCPLATKECTERAIPVMHPSPGRSTRCIHADRLIASARN
jgi:peptide/nickel transport system permease protein